MTSKESIWNPEDLLSSTKVIKSVLKDDTDLYTNEKIDKYLETVIVSGIKMISKGKALTPEYLSKLWHISLNEAQRTIAVTTQRSIRTNEGIKTKRLKAVPHQRLYRQLGNTYLGKFAFDTFKGKVISLRGSSYVQLFVNRGNFIKSFDNGWYKCVF